MPAKLKISFSDFKSWLKRYQITVINAMVTVVLVATVVSILLIQATALQRRTTEEGIISIAEMTALEVQSYFLSYYNIVENMSQIMSNYETFNANQRRVIYNEIMQGLLVSNRNFMNVYSIWKPNALDGLDDAYNEQGSKMGQYITGYTRERGFIEQKSFPEYRYMVYADIFNQDQREGIIYDPYSIMVMGSLEGGRERWVVDIWFPIFRYSSELVGIVGATIDLERLQFQVGGLKPYGTGRTFVCSSAGYVIAHYNYGLRGYNLKNVKDIELLFPSDKPDIIANDILNSIEIMDYNVTRNQTSLIVSYPLTRFDADSASRSSSWSSKIRWSVVTSIPMSTISAPINAMVRFSVIFIIGAGALAVLVFFLTSRSLTRHARSLQRSLEQSTTMQDNLKFGLFLMDQKQTIQGAYSKALEKILSVSDLQGKNFIELLSSSVKDSEKQGIIDYFDMIYKNAFDKDLLESINPINDFLYISIETGEAKSLRTTFSLAEHGIGARYILGTMEDITAEKELQKQLMEAENIRENEMRALFQVIQIDPKVLSDFVVDAEYEFERINDMLKNKRHVEHEALIEMFQSVHAIKSNALILNLEDFSERLHKLESSIRDMREENKEEVPFDDLLALILQIDDTMKEMDRLKATVSKIENFKLASNVEKNQERYVLVETLTRVCNKTQAALDKKVRFIVEGIDEIVLDCGPRRVIKEVLTQLVRNAVYHGIERPEERTPLGKEPEGEIRLSIRYKDNQIVIRLADNGGGIDFARIRQTAEANNMLHNDNEANDKNYLLKTIFVPGFSTLDQADFHAGRGVGLSLVKDRIKDLHGNIAVSTAKGKGTCFTITIPLELRDTAADNVS